MTGAARQSGFAATPNAGGQSGFAATPNAERHVLVADSLRRRQLCAAMLHGTGRNWRDRRRCWPGFLAGAVVTALALAAIAVYSAFQAATG